MDQGDLAALLRPHALRHSVPGAAIGVFREGAAATAYYGVADVTTGEPVTPGTRFSAGSLTKSMVATVIAGLAEAGRFSVDDPVAAHVPELRASDWAARVCRDFRQPGPACLAIENAGVAATFCGTGGSYWHGSPVTP